MTMSFMLKNSTFHKTQHVSSNFKFTAKILYSFFYCSVYNLQLRHDKIGSVCNAFILGESNRELWKPPY